MGHIAIYNELTDTTGVLRRRMIIYGGTAGFGQSPADGNVYELRFTGAASATWSQMTIVDLGDGVPSARFWHAATADPARRPHSSGAYGNIVYVFGGALSDTATASYSGDLWELWLFENGRAGWKKRTEGGTTPGARGRHTLAFDGDQGSQGARLYIYGGRTASGAADRYVYVFDPRKTSPTWLQWAQAPFALEGHTAVKELESGLARIPEVYDPVANGWTALTGAPLYRTHTYPLNFVVPRDRVSDTTRVISVGQDLQAYWLDVPPSGNSTTGWQTNAGLASGFHAQTGVTYRPGRIMIAGGFGVPPVGTTKTLNTDSLGVGWVNRQPMAGRYFHNLVLLPTGKVLAVGGVNTTVQNDTTSAVRRPQLWDPETATWSTLSSLALQGKPRNYHSTALLLPDGRVLSAGGESFTHKFFGEVYCPPYLFKPGTSDTALRPVINSTVTSATWGDEFTVCGDTTGITRVALVRPGATTHTFDQNQRYVPLGFIKKGNPSRLLVRTPASADSAPPGYYMLFVTGSSDGPDVPSFARWVQLRAGPGRDTCDTVAPIARKLYVDLVSSNAVGVTWEAPADDDSIAFSGRVSSYDVRRNSSPITESNWSGSTQATGEPAPLAPGEWETAQVSGLSPCTVYYFAMKSTDDDLEISALGDTTSGRTRCGGGGGLALREDLSGEARAGRPATGAHAGRQSETASLRPAGGNLIVERRRTAAGRWELHVSRVAAVPGMDPEEPAGIVLQNADDDGWKTTGRFESAFDDEVAITSLRGGSRVVFLGNWIPGRAAGAGVGMSGAVALSGAVHSRAGEVTESVVANGLELQASDSVTLTYERAAASGLEAGWFLTVLRGGSGSANSRGPAASESPAAFALHQNEPNPFRATTTIRFDLPRTERVRLEVFDLLGRRVVTLADGEFRAGFHAVPWSARDRAGIGPGIYLYRVIAGGHRSERRMILLP